jgi:hypothetical protein
MKVIMDKRKKKRLEAAGWKVADTPELYVSAMKRRLSSI